jgi:sugar (pentulose or hexulose) kinase
MSLFIGIDIGTSACRACAVDARGAVVAEARTALPAAARTPQGVEQDPTVWWGALAASLDTLCPQIDARQIRRIAVDGTSATLLLCRPDGRPLTPALMYNDARALAAAELIAQHAPPQSPARGASSSLAKCLHLAAGCAGTDWLALHQADWLAGVLSGDYGWSDENNALKLGYDLEQRRWPAWIINLPLDLEQLPRVVPPGTPTGTLRSSLADRWGCGPGVAIVAGTTDSTASFIASGAEQVGTAVSVLGSTLVLKILSDRPVAAASYGVYSHRLGDRWLVGGASNAGGAVLQSLFSNCDIRRFTRLLNPTVATGLDYYPLPARGERFPVQDPQLEPRLQPRPASDAVFFQGILEGLAAIEERGYRLLSDLGAPYPSRVLTVGGGAGNRGWQQIRAQRLRVPVGQAPHQEAAYGAALLALRGQTIFSHP